MLSGSTSSGGVTGGRPRAISICLRRVTGFVGLCGWSFWEVMRLSFWVVSLSPYSSIRHAQLDPETPLQWLLSVAFLGFLSFFSYEARRSYRGLRVTHVFFSGVLADLLASFRWGRKAAFWRSSDCFQPSTERSVRVTRWRRRDGNAISADCIGGHFFGRRSAAVVLNGTAGQFLANGGHFLAGDLPWSF